MKHLKEFKENIQYDIPRENYDIIFTMIAFDRDSSGSFSEKSIVKKESDIEISVSEFEESVPYRKYYMESSAEFTNGDELTYNEIEWFTRYNSKNDIGFES